MCSCLSRRFVSVQPTSQASQSRCCYPAASGRLYSVPSSLHRQMRASEQSRFRAMAAVEKLLGIKLIASVQCSSRTGAKTAPVPTWVYVGGVTIRHLVSSCTPCSSVLFFNVESSSNVMAQPHAVALDVCESSSVACNASIARGRLEKRRERTHHGR